MTNARLDTLHTLVKQLIERDARVSMTLDGRTRYRLAKYFRKLASAYRDLEAARGGLVRQYGTLNEDKTQYSIPANTKELEAYNAEYFKLLSMELPDFTEVKFTDEELNLETNELPVSLLTDLMSVGLLTDDSEPVELEVIKSAPTPAP